MRGESACERGNGKTWCKMGLVIRGGRPYFYRNSRVGGKVVSQYMGRGPLAELLELESRKAADRRKMWAEKRGRHRAWIANLDAAGAPMRAFSNAVEGVFRASMVASGFHLHRRQNWRKGRFMDIDAEALAVIADLPAFNAMIDLAREGDPESRALLGRVMGLELSGRVEGGDVRTLAELLGGDAAAVASDALIALFARGDGAVAEATRSSLAAVRAGLLADSPDPTALETMMVDRIVHAWLDVHTCEMTLSLARARITWDSDWGWKVDGELDRRLDRATKRFDAAVKTLAIARRLAVPAVKDAATRLRIAKVG